MDDKYVLSIDQSTQGTKALLFDESGRLIGRRDHAHRQIVDENSWISHDPEEIYQNLLLAVRDVVKQAGILPEQIVCMGISSQRETSLVWERETGRTPCNAIVWQCARAKNICEKLLKDGCGEQIQTKTGIPLSPYFPASKLAWILQNVPGVQKKYEQHALCFGTIDTWLVYRLTNGKSYKTDISNASRTQLFNLNTLTWDTEVCKLFGISPKDLAEVCASDAIYGMTDLGGFLKKPIPICSVMGDSHAALFGQGCRQAGMAKATYGTGSSVMMNTGNTMMRSQHGLVTSIAWKYRGQVQYVLEGNINYAGAVIRWLQKDLNLITSARESQSLAEAANADDTTYIVPAFSGLGAPYWDSEARVSITGMARSTGRSEIVKAGVECIAYQITDIVQSMQLDTKMGISCFRVDGGASKNTYLMQFQADMLRISVEQAEDEELSGIGAAYMAGLSCGIYGQSVWKNLYYRGYLPQMPADIRARKYDGWKCAVRQVLHGKS